MKYLKILFSVMLSLVIVSSSIAHSEDDISIPNTFDYMGPVVHSVSQGNRDVFYIDEGPRNGIPVVVIWGGGSSIRALRLVDMFRTLRNQLNLRMISVEQNGMGQSLLDPSRNLINYAEDVESVLAHLGIDKFSLFGISFAGPPLAVLAARNPNRIRSLHLASLYSGPNDIEGNLINDAVVGYFCATPLAGLQPYLRFVAMTPKSWWDIGPAVPSQVPGFSDTAYEEGLYNFLVNGQGLLSELDPSAPGKNLAEQITENCPGIGGNDLSVITAPTFIYHGDSDGTVSILHTAVFEQALPNSKITGRIYPDEGHDAGRLHFEQILADIKFIDGDRLVVCERDKQKSLITTEEKANKILRKGGTLGICAWDR
jgi:non-heme chloroperoxidase